MHAENRRIEYVNITEIARWPRTPKEHDLGAIHESIRKHGFVDPLILDETTGRFVAGHGRLDALQQMKVSGDQAPKGIRIDNDQWLAPVMRGIYFDSEQEAESYVIATNQTVMLGGWDWDALTESLSDLAASDMLEGTGFDGDDLDAMLKWAAEDPAPKESAGRDEVQRWEVPDAIWPTDNDWGVPLLDTTMQARALDMPVTKWGTVGRRSKMPGTYHFYTDDYKFNALWDDPSGLIGSQCVNAVEPNFSTGENMPRAVVLWGIYRKRWMARYWQSLGVRVFVDLNVEPDFAALNLLGVPHGWRAYATRWRAVDCDDVPRQFERAKEHAGTESVLFVVVGGRDDAEAACRENGWLWIKEHISEVHDG